MQFVSPSQLRGILQRHCIRPRKGLGQHFLVDGNVIEKILPARGGGTACEIGAGPGTLTLPLADVYERVYAVEIDERFAPALDEVLSGRDNVHVFFRDARTIAWGEICREECVHFFGNLPYGAAAPIIQNFLSSSVSWESARFMLQHEVARRLVAGPGSGDYGPLTLSVSYRARATILHRVSKNCFYPVPEVESALVQLQPVARPEVDFAPFMQVVRAAFGQRRKTLRNALGNSPELQITPGVAEELLQMAGVDARARAEVLTMQDFVQLTAALTEWQRSCGSGL